MDFYIPSRGLFVKLKIFDHFITLSLFTLRSATDISQWVDKFLEHSMLSKMYENLTSRVIVELHSTCDAKYNYHFDQITHLRSVPFQIKLIKCSFPCVYIYPSKLFDNPATVV